MTHHRYGHAPRRHEAAAACPAPDHLTPADRYAELFVDVQSGRVFDDSKTFVDCAPRAEPEAILAAYRTKRGRPGFDLRVFVERHFDVPRIPHSDYVSVPGQALAEHIDGLWPVLTRRPQRHPPRSSLLRLPHDYVVPGGRFSELYYWDSYFTMLGLAESGRAELLHAMTDNFAYLIDTWGHVPNGTRSYYLSRSQPPVFALMVELCEGAGGQPAVGYLPQLLKEHAFWMDGAEALAPGEAHRRVVRLADGTLLNRYWDERDTPREEAWIEDVRTARESTRPAGEVYRDLRAAAESGWDFSSRWLAEADDGGDTDASGDADGPTEAEGLSDAGGTRSTAGARAAEPAGVDDVNRRPAPPARLADICTTRILPVDLNAFLFKLERTVAALGRAAGQSDVAERFEASAERRRQDVLRLMWDDAAGTFRDHDWCRGRNRRALTAACVVPLFVGLADAARAARQADTVERRLLAPGGLATTERTSGQQWDRPNGWAPLQWMAIAGLAAYGHGDLADRIEERWLAVVSEVYDREAKLVEKYACHDPDTAPAAGGGGGEYPLQDGFGWTNGVVRRLLHRRAAAGQPVSSQPVKTPSSPD